jgi:hypothetical protein
MTRRGSIKVQEALPQQHVDETFFACSERNPFDFSEYWDPPLSPVLVIPPSSTNAGTFSERKYRLGTGCIAPRAMPAQATGDKWKDQPASRLAPFVTLDSSQFQRIEFCTASRLKSADKRSVLTVLRRSI